MPEVVANISKGLLQEMEDSLNWKCPQIFSINQMICTCQLVKTLNEVGSKELMALENSENALLPLVFAMTMFTLTFLY